MHLSPLKTFFRGRYSILLAVAVLMAVGFGVRYYQFDEWLYFKMDQARDAAIIGNAVTNGPEYLPLLGPRAGATKLEHGRLRVGPVYYYMQYLSGVLSGSVEPYVFAYPDLFFGVLAIPMLYILLRRYFSRWTAYGVAALYGLCFIVIQYARFAWNPNTLPFFLFLAFYGMLRFLDEPDAKRRYRWLTLWAIGMTIGAQLHFFGVFSLIGISGLMILWHYGLWQRATWKQVFTKRVMLPTIKYLGTALAIALVLYTPAIISDTFKGGQNFHNFFEAMGSKPDKKPFLANLNESIHQDIRYYCVITTASCTNDAAGKNQGMKVFTGIFLILGFLVAIIRLRRIPEGGRKDFLRLVIVWVAVFSILAIPVASQLRPRFYLVVMAVPFIFWGLLYEYAQERWKRLGQGVLLVVFVALLGMNIQGTRAWFAEQAASQVRNAKVERTLILKAKDGVTLGQLQRVTDFMYSHLDKGNRLYFYVKPEHVSPLKYLLSLKRSGDPGLSYQPMQMNADPTAQYFVVVPSEQIDFADVQAKFGTSFQVLSQESIGQLLVAEIRFTDRQTSATFRFNKAHGKSDRVFWKDVFGIRAKPGAAVIDDEE